MLLCDEKVREPAESEPLEHVAPSSTDALAFAILDGMAAQNIATEAVDRLLCIGSPDLGHD